MRRCVLALGCVLAVPVSAQTASFDPATSELSVPAVQVTGTTTRYANVVLSLQPGGAWAVVSSGPASTATTFPASTNPLSVLPSAVTATALGESVVIQLAGGAAPYTVASTRPSVAAIVSVQEDPNFPRATVTARAVANGSTDIVVGEAGGTQVSMTVGVNAAQSGSSSSSGSLPASTNSLVASPAAIVARSGGEQIEIQVAGGAELYSVASSRPGVVTIDGLQQDPVVARATVTAHTRGAGTAVITITEARGTQVAVTVTVQ